MSTKLGPVLLVTLLAIAPLIMRDQYFIHLLITCLVYAILVSNWDLVIGYGGLFNFGFFASFGIGAYTSGILGEHLGISPWIGLPAGAIFAALIGLLMGVPCLRLKGIYVCLFTFVFQQVVYFLMLYNPWGLTGGVRGLLVHPFELGSINFGGANKILNFYLVLGIFLVSTFFLYKVVKGRVGLAFVSLRDSETYAQSRGVDAYKYNLIAFAISSFFAGLAGAFYVHYQQLADLSLVGLTRLSIGLCMIVVGGLGTIYGPIVAAFLLTFLLEYLNWLGPYRYIIVGVLILLVIIFARGGLAKILNYVNNRLSAISGRVPHERTDSED